MQPRPIDDIPIFGREVWNRTLAYASDRTLLSCCGLSHAVNFVETVYQDR